MRVIISGASGFVGRIVVEEFLAQGAEVIKLNRNRDPEDLYSVDYDQLEKNPEMLSAFDTFIHLAGIAHGKEKNFKGDSDVLMQSVNTDLVKDMAERFFSYSSGKFIFLSSLSVYGLDKSSFAIDEHTPARPITAYGRSKLAAEKIPAELADKYGGRYSIIRVPMIYGADAPANFGNLIKFARYSFIIPFKNARAKRSNIGVRNLSDFLYKVATSESSSRQIFVVADETQQSFFELLTSLRGHSKGIVPFPPILIKLLLTGLGRPRMYDQLFSPLFLDPKKAYNLLGWKQRYDFQDNMRPALDANSVSRSRMPPLNKRFYYFVKRLMDFVLSIVGLMAILPILAAIAIVIFLDDPGPIIFKQERAGASGVPPENWTVSS